MKTKTFDCVKMKHEAQQRLQRELSRLTPIQKLDYYKKRHEQLIERQKQLREKRR